jgi:hypothetical protein
VDVSIQFGEWEGVKIPLEPDIFPDFRRIHVRPGRAAGHISDLQALEDA